MNTFRKGVFGFLILSIGFIVFTGLYASRPWNRDLEDEVIDRYMVLVVLLLYNATPHAGLIWLSRLFNQQKTALTVFLAGASVIAAWGLYLMVMSFYVRADTLAGVIFFFMPVLQWIAGAVLVVICLATKGLGELKE